ncbi:MAG: hypothetical protein R6V04_14395 [bacterium]
MKLYIFSNQSENINDYNISKYLSRVADSTETADLIVALYLMEGIDQTRGTAYVHQHLTPRKFITGRGRWSFTRQFPLPADLPRTFKLIRLRIDCSSSRYPYTEKDIYGWEFYYPSFIDHLATLFAHELHHFRRYHLKLHPGEGEQSANKWAIQHVQSLGYGVKAKKLRKRKGKKISYTTFIKKFPQFDPYVRFRHLKKSDKVRITYDPSRKYLNQIAKVKRPIRSNSKRLVLVTKDGKSWRWPLEWLEEIKTKE